MSEAAHKKVSESLPNGLPIRPKSTSTVGRGKAVTLPDQPESSTWADDLVDLRLADSIECYATWPEPTVIVSDGAYGVLGFEGDTSDHLGLSDWYEPHVRQWSRRATPQTSLWFWNSEIGWATVHPLLERYGWRYVNANIWDKSKAHIAGNVNTTIIRRFPVVTEVCVQYCFEARIDGMPLKKWILSEWQRTGLPLRAANSACGVADAAVRKYFDQGHLWYFPPPDRFEMLANYANAHGKAKGRPYFSLDGVQPAAAADWARMRYKFRCPHGVTNVWTRPPLHGSERIRTPEGKAVHLNQKPLDLIARTIEAASDTGDVLWEPFGGLFSASLAARGLQRRAFGAEIDSTYYQYGVERFLSEGPIPRG